MGVVWWLYGYGWWVSIGLMSRVVVVWRVDGWPLFDLFVWGLDVGLLYDEAIA